MKNSNRYGLRFLFKYFAVFSRPFMTGTLRWKMSCASQTAVLLKRTQAPRDIKL